MPELDRVAIYVFDLFESSQVDELKSKLDSQFGSAKEHPLTLIQGGIITKETTDTRYIWEVKDHDVIIDKAVEVGKGGLVGDVTFAKKAIEKIEFLGIKSQFPFFVLLMIVSVHKSVFDINKIFVELSNVARPLRLFLEEFNGAIRQIRPEKPMCPFFVDIHLTESPEGIEKILHELYELQDFPAKGALEDNFYDWLENSQKIRNIVPLQNIKQEFNFLSCPFFASDNVLFTGHFDQIVMNGLMTPFALHFSTLPFPKSTIDISRSLILRASTYDRLLVLNHVAESMIYLTVMLGWASFLFNKLGKLESELNESQRNIQSQLKSYKAEELEKRVIKLEHNKIEIADLISQVGGLRRHAESNLTDFMKGGPEDHSELPILPSKDGYYYIWRDFVDDFGSQVFVKGLSQKIMQTLKKVESSLEQYNHEYEIFQNSINNIISLENQRQTKSHNKTMKYLTVAIFIFAAFSTFSAIEYGIEYIQPDFIVNRPHIDLNLSPHTGNQIEYVTPIILQTATSNSFRYTIQLVEDSFEVQSFGGCFFTKEPKVVSLYTAPFFLSPNKSEMEIEPNLRLSYDTTLPYFSPEKLESTVYHSVGNLEFRIIAEDVNDPSNSYVIPVNADVTMSPPGGLYFDAGKHCEKIEKSDE